MNRPALFAGRLLLILVPLLTNPDLASCQSALDVLLQKVSADEEAGDRNVYSLTSIQAVLGASLSWNALLRRAILVEPEGGLTFALVVESPLGRVGNEIVEWPDPPTQRRGEVYVSRGLLEIIFRHYPRYRIPGQEDVPSEPTPEGGQGTGETPEEPPPSAHGGDQPIKTVVAVVLPSKATIASGTAPTPADAVIEELRKVLEGSGIELETIPWGTDTAEKTYAEGDALLALRVEAATPPMRASFCYYDAPGTPGDSKAAGWEWSRVSLVHKRDSRAIADLIHRNYVGVFGEKRSIGLRGAPFDVLQGREMPSVLINLSLLPSALRQEAKRTAEVIGHSLAQIRKG